MTIIGITGPSGGGKTSALHALQSLGALVIDCDAVYHELLLTSTVMIKELDCRFAGVVENSVLNRKALGRIVFSDSAALEDLNAITHRYISQEVSKRLKEWEDSGGRVAAVDAIALIESGLGARCTVVVGLTAPMDVRIKRIMLRDGVSEDYARLRLGAQKSDSYFYENCDYVLVSDGDKVEDFETKCREFFTGLLGGMDNDRT